MRGSSATRVRLAIGAAVSVIALAVLLSGEDPSRDTPTPPDASEHSIALQPAARASEPPDRGESREAVDAAGSRASRGEEIRRAAISPSVPPWAREALELSDDATLRVLTNRDPVRAGGGLDPRDLAVLADIIAASDLSEASSAFDYDDGNGHFAPWELGFQVWENGRLVLLAMGPSSHFSFGYRQLALPDSLGELARVRVLALHGSELDRLPDTIGMLQTLRQLVLHDNRLSELPRSIEGLWQLRELQLAANSLAFLPSELGSLGLLEILNASDNPLTLIEEGALGLPLLRLLDLERTRRPQDPGAPTWGQLRELPDELGTLHLDELRIGGNLLYCDGGPPASHLMNGSIVTLVGLGAQRCGSIQ